MKKILYMIMVLLLMTVTCVSLVACDDIATSELVDSTNKIWQATASKTAVEKVILKDVVIAGAVTIQNVDINIERTITADKTTIKLNTANLTVKVNKEAEEAVQLILKVLNMHGKVTVAQLESVISKISFELNSTVTAEQVQGTLKINNVVNLFSAQKSEPLILNFDKTMTDDNPWISQVSNIGKEHLINQFKPIGDENIKTGTSHDVEFVKDDGIEIAKSILLGLGDKPLPNPDLTVNKILYNAFGTSDPVLLLNRYLNIDNLSSMYNIISSNSEKFINKMSVNGDFKLSVSKEQLFVIVENISNAMNSPKVNEVFCMLGVLIKYDDNFATGKVQIDSEYKLH